MMRLFRQGIRRKVCPAFVVGVHTDRGAHPRNEDAYVTDPDRGLFAIADGMGGHPAGDLAARITIEELPARLDDELEQSRRIGPALVRAALAVNDVVIGRAVADPDLTDMGSTLVLAYVDGRTAHILNVGDSRAYLLDSKGFRRLTEDQTYAAELVHDGILDLASARRHPFAHAIAHAIGRQDIRPDLDSIELSDGDRLLLCSDGLVKSLSDEQIGAVLYAESDPARACENLVAAARDAGERDDVSVIVVRCDYPDRTTSR